MNEPKPDGGPAFPGINADVTNDMHNGMTLRDWFAGMALQGLLAGDSEQSISNETAAKIAYDQADAMLKERERA